MCQKSQRLGLLATISATPGTSNRRAEQPDTHRAPPTNWLGSFGLWPKASATLTSSGHATRKSPKRTIYKPTQKPSRALFAGTIALTILKPAILEYG